MKKSLLFLGLLGMTSTAYSQGTPPPPFGIGRWTAVNVTNVQTFGDYIMDDINTVSANVAWGLNYEDVAAPARPHTRTYVRTNNAAGTEFDFNTVTGPTSDFDAANIDGITDQIAVCAMYNSAAGGGAIVRTIDGGQSWTNVSGSNFAGADGFPNFVHMFNATTGVSFGDPNGGGFEMVTTNNGGLTWTRVPQANVPAPVNNEYGLVRSYFALPGTGTIWASTNNTATATLPDGPVRMLKSTNFGQTWTIANTPLIGSVSRIAFKDALNGIAFNRRLAPGAPTTPPTPGTINVIRTSDGGLTWQSITPVSSPSGQFYASDIDAVPAVGSTPGFYVSSGGSRVPNATGPTPNSAIGSSTSGDGITWKDIDNGVLVNATSRRVYLCMDVLSATAGYAGGFIDASGEGGIYKLNAATPLPTRAATERVSLNAYPNPSTGLFQVRLEEGVKAVTQLTVTDALGRRVLTRTLTPSTANSGAISVDLTKEKAGVYVLELRNEAGVSQKKIVVQ